MASIDPNLGLAYGWALGESGWKDAMDANLKRVGALVGLSVKSRGVTAPPATPADGDRYLVPATATGAWAGKGAQVVVRVAGVWEYHVPKVGWLAYVEDEAVLSAYKVTGWSPGITL